MGLLAAVHFLYLESISLLREVHCALLIDWALLSGRKGDVRDIFHLCLDWVWELTLGAPLSFLSLSPFLLILIESSGFDHFFSLVKWLTMPFSKIIDKPLVVIIPAGQILQDPVVFGGDKLAKSLFLVIKINYHSTLHYITILHHILVLNSKQLSI